MQALTPELLSEATAKLMAQLPMQNALPSEPYAPVTTFAPASPGSPVASSFPAQPTAPAVPTQVPFSGTPSRPPGTPTLPRVGFPAAEVPASHFPPMESMSRPKPTSALPISTEFPGLSMPGFSAPTAGFDVPLSLGSISMPGAFNSDPPMLQTTAPASASKQNG